MTQTSHAVSRELGAPIAAGNEAEIFAWGDKVLKLSKRIGDPTQAEHEAAVLRAVSPLGLGPALEGIIEIEGRWGLVMERVHEPTLASALADPALLPELLDLMVSLHRRIHAIAAPEGLPDLKQRLAVRIARAERLTRELRDDLLARLAGGYYPDLARAYLEAYLDEAGLDRATVEAWMPFIAAARLVENVPAEFDRLVQLAQGRALG